MNELYKHMYFQLYVQMADMHQTLQDLLQEIEAIMQKTEELYNIRRAER